MRENIKDFISEYGYIILFTLLFLLAAFLGHIGYKFECQHKTSEIGFENRYSFFGGCQIQIGERWIPLENYYVIEDSE